MLTKNTDRNVNAPIQSAPEQSRQPRLNHFLSYTSQQVSEANFRQFFSNSSR